MTIRPHLRGVSCLIIVLFSTAPGAATTIDFQAPRNFRAGFGPFWVEAGDFNGDGILDLAVAEYRDQSVSVLLGDGTGRFGPPRGFPINGGTQALAIADMNLDGRADLVVPTYSGSVDVLLGDGTGGFFAPRGYSSGAATSIATADFNGDGRPDVAVNVFNQAAVYVLLGDGLGGLALPFSLHTGNLANQVIAPDLNRDGRPDLAVATGSGGVTVILNAGGGGFGAPKDYASVTNASSLVALDLNGDGYPDLVAGRRDGPELAVLLNDGSGGFGTAQFLGGGGFGAVLRAADLNGDGHDDLIVGHGFDLTVQNLSVLAGDGAGHLAAPVPFETDAVPVGLAAGDFDRDGHEDVVTANYSGNDVTFLAGSGTGRLQSVARLPLPFDPWAMAAADFNGDGRPDLAVVNFNPPTFAFSSAAIPPAPTPGVGLSAGAGAVSSSVQPNGPLDCDGFPMLVSIFLSSPPGGVSFASAYPVRCQPLSMAVADFNGDGRLDIVTGNAGVSDISFTIPPSLTVLLGDGAGGFPASRDMQLTDSPASMAAGDFNEDGITDLAIAPQSGGFVSVFRGDGTGGFSFWRSLNTVTRARTLKTADLNNDGHLDLVMTLPDAYAIGIAYGQGLFGFGSVNTVQVSNGPADVLVADLNGDHVLDLISANSGLPGAPEDTLWVMLGYGPGLFQSPFVLTVGTSPHAVAAGDFDLDGDLDLVGLAGNRDASVMVNNGAGRFDGLQRFGTAGGTVAVVAADFSGDGITDLAVAGRYPDSVSLLYNVTPVARGPRLSVAPDLLQWTGTPGAIGYDVVYGDLGTLARSGGDFTAAVEGCMANDLPEISLPYAMSPPLGSGFWFLVRDVTPSGPGSYDSGFPGQVGSRDAEIDGSPLACP